MKTLALALTALRVLMAPVTRAQAKGINEEESEEDQAGC